MLHSKTVVHWMINMVIFGIYVVNAAVTEGAKLWGDGKTETGERRTETRDSTHHVNQHFQTFKPFNPFNNDINDNLSNHLNTLAGSVHRLNLNLHPMSITLKKIHHRGAYRIGIFFPLQQAVYLYVA